MKKYTTYSHVLIFFIADGVKVITYIHCLQVAITTPEGGSRVHPYIKISPYK